MKYPAVRRYLGAAVLPLLLLFGSASVLLSQANSAQAKAPRVDFEKYTLPNGLEVILHVDRKLPMVNVNSWYHVGSKNEREGRTGFAHLFEHMMFEGSKDANVKYLSLVEKAGANVFQGGVNGTTNEDRTNYFETVPSGSLEYALWLESDRLATLTDVLTQTKLDNERDIVKNERRQSLENQPYGRAFYLLSEYLFPAGHPYAHSVIGSQEDLTAASVDDVKTFFKTYYTPNNLSIAITGDFDIPEAKRLIAKYYAPVPPGPALDRPKLWVPTLSTEKVVDIKDRVAQERTYFAWPSPAFFEAGDADLDLASLVLTDGLSSRLTKSLVYDKQLCSDVVSFQGSSEIAGTFVAWATARPGANLAAAEAVVTQEIARLAAQGPTEEELNRAKSKWEFQYVTGLERIGGFGGQADLLNQYNTFLGDPDKFAADVARHRAVTTVSLQAAAAKWLNTSNRLLLRFHPESLAPESNASLDRGKPPSLGRDLPFQVPAVKTARLDNGMQIFVVERTDLPKVDVTLATRAGSVDDPSGLEGLANLGVATMRRGTKTRKALQIDDTLGDLGAGLEGRVDREYATFDLQVLRSHLAPAFSILSDVVRNASFPADEVDREKKKAADEVTQAESEPDGIARRVAPMLAFGRDHPYGHPIGGFRSTIEKISPADLAKFHDTFWKPGSSALIFVGDIALNDAVRLSNESFGSWTGGAAPSRPTTSARPVGPGKVYLVDRHDAAQTDVSLVLPGTTRTSSDYYPLMIADAVWGGAIGARLGTNLREDKGYSYGVFSVPHFYSTHGTWIAEGAVQTNKTKESVVEFEKELRFIAGQKPVSPTELTSAKETRVRGYAQQFESLDHVAAQIAKLWSLSLPMSEMQREPEELTNTTLQSVNAAAEKYATPSNSSLLLVGDAAKIEAGVRELKIGELVRLDPEGKPVAKQ